MLKPPSLLLYLLHYNSLTAGRASFLPSLSRRVSFGSDLSTPDMERYGSTDSTSHTHPWPALNNPSASEVQSALERLHQELQLEPDLLRTPGTTSVASLGSGCSTPGHTVQGLVRMWEARACHLLEPASPLTRLSGGGGLASARQPVQQVASYALLDCGDLEITSHAVKCEVCSHQITCEAALVWEILSHRVDFDQIEFEIASHAVECSVDILDVTTVCDDQELSEQSSRSLPPRAMQHRVSVAEHLLRCSSRWLALAALVLLRIFGMRSGRAVYHQQSGLPTEVPHTDLHGAGISPALVGIL